MAKDRLAQEKTHSFVSPAFVGLMRRELKANARKGDWRAWRPDTTQATRELQYHVDKLSAALAGGVSEFTADVANLCMMISHLFGESDASKD